MASDEDSIGKFLRRMLAKKSALEIAQSLTPGSSRAPRLEILGMVGEGKARALAEFCGALALAGEISVIAALCSGEFTRAHKRLARGSKPSSGASRG